jgi:hypothetical protein
MAQNYSTREKRPATYGADSIMAKGQMADSSKREKEGVNEDNLPLRASYN